MSDSSNVGKVFNLTFDASKRATQDIRDELAIVESDSYWVEDTAAIENLELLNGGYWSASYSAENSGYCVLLESGTDKGIRGLPTSNISVNRWESFTMPFAVEWTGIVSNGQYYVAVAKDTTRTAYSEYCREWKEGPSFSQTGCIDIVYAGDKENGKFMCIFDGSDTPEYLSVTDNTLSSEWMATKGKLPASQKWSAITYGDGTFFAVASDSAIATKSTDGEIWESVTLPFDLAWGAATYGGGKFAIIMTDSNGGVYYSKDLSTWVDGGRPTINYEISKSSPEAISSFKYLGDRFIVTFYDAEDSSDWNQYVSYSKDLKTWHDVKLPLNNHWVIALYYSDRYTIVPQNSTTMVQIAFTDPKFKQYLDATLPKNLLTYSYGTTDLIDGESALESGSVYFCIEGQNE